SGTIHRLVRTKSAACLTPFIGNLLGPPLQSKRQRVPGPCSAADVLRRCPAAAERQVLQEDYFLVLSIHTAVLSVPAAHSVSVILCFLCLKGAVRLAVRKSRSIGLPRRDIQRLDEMLDPLDGPADLLDALENEIQRAKVAGHDRVGADIVTMNSRVRFV